MKVKIKSEIDIDVQELDLDPIALVYLLKKHKLNRSLAKSTTRFALKFLDPAEKKTFLRELLEEAAEMNAV